jgi:NADPH-dependent curcumin reductase
VSDFDLTRDHFRMEQVSLHDLEEGQALVRTKLINLHSGTRARMASNRRTAMSGMTAFGDTDRTSYACAEVIESRDPAFAESNAISCHTGWQDNQVISSQDAPVGGYEPASEVIRAVNHTCPR